jgi:ribosome maturation factor RimP
MVGTKGGCLRRPFLFSTLEIPEPSGLRRSSRLAGRAFFNVIPLGDFLTRDSWLFKTVNSTQQRIADRVRALTEEVIAGTSYFIVDVQVRGHKGTRVVEVYIDSVENFGHDDLAVVSKEVGFLLDVEDVVDGSYKLEVSSPGIKRPLTMPQQYQKNVGRTLRVRYESDGNEEIVVGDLMEADDNELELELSSGERLQLSYQSVTQARIELPW